MTPERRALERLLETHPDSRLYAMRLLLQKAKEEEARHVPARS